MQTTEDLRWNEGMKCAKKPIERRNRDESEEDHSRATI
jgi:hypothetical protein